VTEKQLELLQVLAEANGAPVSNEAIAKRLGIIGDIKARVRDAKSRAIAKIVESFERRGRAAPADVADLIVATGGGYRAGVACWVR